MSYNAKIHHRRSLRLHGYDYTQAGGYFVTLVVKDRQDLFGVVIDGDVHLNQFGEMIHRFWLEIPVHFSYINLDDFVIMPNHLHAIVLIQEHCRGEASRRSNRDASPLPVGTMPGSLGAIIQNFKSVSTRRINQIRQSPGFPIWQRNYYEHIIRNEKELSTIRQYIRDNPVKWSLDSENCR